MTTHATILRLLIEKSMTLADLQDASQLSMPTVRRFMAELSEAGWVRPAGVLLFLVVGSLFPLHLRPGQEAACAARAGHSIHHDVLTWVFSDSLPVVSLWCSLVLLVSVFVL